MGRRSPADPRNNGGEVVAVCHVALATEWRYWCKLLGIHALYSCNRAVKVGSVPGRQGIVVGTADLLLRSLLRESFYRNESMQIN